MVRTQNKYANVKKGAAYDIGDGNFYNSGWERDVARFLNLLVRLGIVEGWAYEPETFDFQGLGYKRGPFVYKPDFAVRYRNTLRPDARAIMKDIFDEVHPGKTVFWEVKGREHGSDRNKWRRFRKHTDYPLEIIKRDKMFKIQTAFAPMIEHWESKIRE